MMERPRETYGRYCLPVYENAPITAHPAYQPALQFFYLGSAIMLASHHDVFHAGRGLQMTIDLTFAVTASGLAVLLVWIRKELRRTARIPDRHAR